MKKINVIISNDNKYAVTDWNAREWYLSLNDGDTATVATGTMLNELRVGVRSEEIEQFSFEFKGQTINCGESGQLSDWPIGLFDHLMIQMYSLMKGIPYGEAKKQAHDKKRG
ncbi:MAG TPA: hypothetical protein EYN67_01185 [Flavobacteriales bacterium]|nr:hypothetical protein [Methylococcaceae bacterium]HHZ94181.1 hypothetical protein [Flavobacteriales bacterium]